MRTPKQRAAILARRQKIADLFSVPLSAVRAAGRSGQFSIRTKDASLWYDDRARRIVKAP